MCKELTLIRGDSGRRIYGTERVQADVRAAFVAASSLATRKSELSDGIYDIRRGKQHPANVLLRRIDELVCAESPRKAVLGIVRVIEDYVHSQYPTPSAPAARKAA